MAYYNEYIGEDIRKDEIQDYKNIVRVKAQQCTIKPFFTNMAHQLTLTWVVSWAQAGAVASDTKKKWQEVESEIHIFNAVCTSLINLATWKKIEF